MKGNYKLQNTNYKQITNYKLQITNYNKKKEETTDYTDYTDFFIFSLCPFV